MSTPTEDGVEEAGEPQKLSLVEKEEDKNLDETQALRNAVDEETRAAELDNEQVDPKVLADQPQPAPPPQPRRMRFTVLCGRKVGSDEDNVYRRDIAAVHIMGANLEEAKVNAITLLAANVKDTTVNDWESILGYLGHLEIL